MVFYSPELFKLLAYENDLIVQQFIQDNPTISLARGQQIFKDLLAWMWLSVYRKQKNLKTYLFGPLLELDKIWHVFILNTRLYSQFCQYYFGEYFHHDVEPMGNETELSEDELSEFLGDCYDFLGEEWVLRNFQRNYSPPF